MQLITKCSIHEQMLKDGQKLLMPCHHEAAKSSPQYQSTYQQLVAKECLWTYSIIQSHVIKRLHIHTNKNIKYYLVANVQTTKCVKV